MQKISFKLLDKLETNISDIDNASKILSDYFEELTDTEPDLLKAKLADVSPLIDLMLKTIYNAVDAANDKLTRNKAMSDKADYWAEYFSQDKETIEFDQWLEKEIQKMLFDTESEDNEHE